MPRAKNSVATKRRHRKVLKKAKGFRSSRSRQFRSASVAVIKAQSYAYRDRKARKREMRKLWIVRINAAVRQFDMSYSQFIAGLSKAGNEMNRKVLADLAVNDPATIGSLVQIAKEALAS